MVNNRNDGGSAFPATMPYSDHGMSLRDYFAAKAMAGFIAGPNGPEWGEKEIALSAYSMADAMLKAREKTTQAPAVVPSDPASPDDARSQSAS